MDGIHYHPSLKSKKDKEVKCQKKEGHKGRSPRRLYQNLSSQPASPRREEEQEQGLEEAIFPKIQDPKNSKRGHVKCLQLGQSLDGIETTSFTKEKTLYPVVVNTLTQIGNSIIPLEDIKNSLLSSQEINNNLSSLTKGFVEKGN
ncbi:hypothetical protein O181_007131 [Austropuccinia psidii MF-1]|uniref:Uncharacterized protein n=1 Tax=Austropuccinia psidii MF-1 TaxID=1389203 RepID=A0A9Q3BKA1_9BASI|nr:hypothetical protein [Austropuccinia psidii MF-1]